MIDTVKDLHALWKKEYEAPFYGWDFSYLKDRWSLENPPWNYEKLVRRYIKKSKALLDIGTGGGEFLASFTPLPAHTCSTECWQPNISVARAKLEPMGVKVMETDETEILPFDSEEFDIVIDRHESFKPAEVFRVLKPGGIFLTQQVADNNLHDFAEAFETGIPIPFLKETFEYYKYEFRNAGFKLIRSEKWRGKQEFFDVGAIAYYIKAIPCTVPGFDIDKNMPDLDKLQLKLDNGERLIFTQGRFLFQAQKPLGVNLWTRRMTRDFASLLQPRWKKAWTRKAG